MGSCESCNGPRTPTLDADERPEKITEFEGLEVAEVNSLRKEFMDMDKVLSPAIFCLSRTHILVCQQPTVVVAFNQEVLSHCCNDCAG